MLFTPEQTREIQELIDSASILQAVKMVKELLGTGLYDSKEIVDFWRANNTPPASLPPYPKRKTDVIPPPDQ